MGQVHELGVENICLWVYHLYSDREAQRWHYNEQDKRAPHSQPSALISFVYVTVAPFLLTLKPHNDTQSVVNKKKTLTDSTP